MIMVESRLYNTTHRQDCEGGTIFTVEINGSHKVFEGHFPSMPVMPGVCTLMIIKQLSSEIIGRPLRFEQIKECKFVSAILPNKCNVVEMKVLISKDESGYYKVTSMAVCEGKIVLKLKADMN